MRVFKPTLIVAMGLGSLLLSDPAASENSGWESCGYPEPRNEQEAMTLIQQLFQKQLREELATRHSRMTVRKPASLNEALERRLFDKATIEEVARRELLHKKIDEVDRILKGLGFKGGPHLYGWNEPPRCVLYLAYVGLTIFWEKTKWAKDVEVQILYTGL
jgi:hypothetical protein